jgi:hypothetical protein
MASEEARLVVNFEARINKFPNHGAASSTSTNTAKKIEGDFRRTSNVLRFETSNLAAQFQDIGVQLTGGATPFLIALQQGTQITQVLGNRGGGWGVAILRSAFASLLNPAAP